MAVVILVAAGLSLCGPLLFDRILPTSDTRLHSIWIEQFAKALSEGVLFPRWVQSTYGGLGDPAFVYLHPTFYYAASAFRLIGCSTQSSAFLVLWVANVATGWVAYHYLRMRLQGSTALFLAVTVQLSPSLTGLGVLYSAFPWYASTAALVLAFFAIARTLDSGRFTSLLPVSAGTFLCVVTHVLSGLMLIICSSAALAVLALDGKRRADRARGLIIATLGISLGLGASAFYLYPALVMRDQIATSQWFVPGVLDWHNSFLFATITHLKYGSHWSSFQYVFPGVSAVILAIAVVISRRHVRWSSAQLFFAFAAVAALFFGSELSYGLWEYSDTLRQIQRGYRFQVPLAVASVGCLACALSAHGTVGRFSTRRVSIAVMSVCLLLTVLVNAKTVVMDGVPRAQAFSHDEYPRGAREYVTRTRGYRWQAYVDEGGVAGYCRSVGADCDVKDNQSHRVSVGTNSPEPFALALPRFAYPGWRISVDGLAVPAGMDLATGLVSAAVPAGRHLVALRRGLVEREWTGIGLSLLSLAAALAFRWGGAHWDRLHP